MIRFPSVRAIVASKKSSHQGASMQTGMFFRYAAAAFVAAGLAMPVQAKDLRVNVNADPEMIDPITFSALIAGDVLRNVYQSFSRTDEKGVVNPALATTPKVEMVLEVTALKAGKTQKSVAVNRHRLNVDESSIYYSTDFPTASALHGSPLPGTTFATWRQTRSPRPARGCHGSAPDNRHGTPTAPGGTRCKEGPGPAI